MASARSYFTNGVIYKYETKKKTSFIAGGIISGLFLLMIPLAFTSNPELKPYVLFYALCAVPGLILIWHGVKLGKRIDLARRFNSIFACDTDGFVTLAELKQQTGLGEQEVLRELETLFRKGFFEHCSLQQSGRVGVQLALAEEKDDGTGFVQVSCPKCGGTTSLRAGTYGKCDFCSGPIHANTDQD